MTCYGFAVACTLLYPTVSRLPKVHIWQVCQLTEKSGTENIYGLTDKSRCYERLNEQTQRNWSMKNRCRLSNRFDRSQ